MSDKIVFLLNVQIGMAAAELTGAGWILIVIGFGLGTAVSFYCYIKFMWHCKLVTVWNFKVHM